MHALTETLSAGLLLVQSGHDWGGGGPPWDDGDHGFSPGPWILVPFLLWIGFGALVAWIVTRLFPRRRDGGGSSPVSRDPAEEILRERFARGEISTEEYLRSRRILRGEIPPDITNPDDEREANPPS